MATWITLPNIEELRARDLSNSCYKRISDLKTHMLSGKRKDLDIEPNSISTGYEIAVKVVVIYCLNVSRSLFHISCLKSLN